MFSVCLIILTLVIGFGTSRFSSPSFLNLILISLSAATWLVYFFIEKTATENFIKNYLLTIVLKLLVGGIFISILIYLDLEGAESNALLFMISYLLLTGLEVGFLFRKFGKS